MSSVASPGAEVHFIAGDADDSTRMADEAAELLGGRIDTFVSSVAPGGHLGPVQRQDTEEPERVRTGLVLPVLQMNRAVLTHMHEAGGTIVTIASDDVAATVLWLASPAAAKMTGQAANH